MLFRCWANVADGGPTLKQHWVNVSCSLGVQKSPAMSVIPTSLNHRKYQFPKKKTSSRTLLKNLSIKVLNVPQISCVGDLK